MILEDIFLSWRFRQDVLLSLLLFSYIKCVHNCPSYFFLQYCVILIYSFYVSDSPSFNLFHNRWIAFSTNTEAGRSYVSVLAKLLCQYLDIYIKILIWLTLIFWNFFIWLADRMLFGSFCSLSEQ